MGKQLAKAIVRKSLAVGADDLVLVEDPLLDTFDSYFSAVILAAAIKKIARYDVVLCGRQASDTDAGQVGSGIAEILGVPCITLAKKLDFADGKLKVERVLPDGYETVETTLPAVVTATNEMGELRSASVMAIVQAQKKPLTTWRAADLGLDVSKLTRSQVVKLFIAARQVQCQVIPGATPEDAGANLAAKLKEAKIL
jgi:electron transfer flavoprotein beta subunit